MKKIIMLSAAVLLTMAGAHCQKAKIVKEKGETAVAESSVPMNNVRDFQNQHIADAHNVQWVRIDSATYEVRYEDADDNQQGIRYKAFGSGASSTERRYYIAEQYYPRAVRDTVAKHYKGYTISQLCVSEIRRKTTYEARISKTSGFLFWKKESDVKHLNFEINGKFIDEN